MKTKISFVILSLAFALSSKSIADNNPCVSTKTSGFYKDTVSNVYKCMKTDLSYQESQCQTFVLELKDSSINLSMAYQLAFYIQNEQSAKIKISFSSGGSWSEEHVIDCKAGKGRRQFAIAPASLGTSIDYTKINRMKISFESSASIYFDELNFNIPDAEKKTAEIGYVTQKLKTVKKKFNENAQKEGVKSDVSKKRDFDLR